jgi:signal transduction histidine kinase
MFFLASVFAILLAVGVAAGNVMAARQDKAASKLAGRYQALREAGVRRSLRQGLAWSAVAVAVVLLLVLAAVARVRHMITRPPRGLPLAPDGPIGAQDDRVRVQEAESSRLRAMARAVGIRIRESLVAGDVIGEARLALEQNIDADAVYLHLVIDGKMSPPVGHEHDWLLAGRLATALPAEVTGTLWDLFRRQTSAVTQDVQGEEGELIPAWVRGALREAGVQSHVLTPFGVGEDMLGFIVADRTHPGHPWSAAEVDAVESIAADLGRGLSHARLYEAENRLVEDLKSLDAARSDFFATVSHELRSPLTSIEGYVEMLKDEVAGPVTPEQGTMLATVERSAARLRNLIEDVFMLSKLESGAIATVMRPVNLAEVIAGAVQEEQPEVAGKGLTLTTAYPGDDLIVAGDAGQLDRVLVNLVSNAVKFTPSGGRIEVTGAAEGGVAVVAVHDSGIGIPEDDQKELFTRFFRASNAREQCIHGTGLGLAIVRTIVDNHGGEVALASHEGQGTTVVVRIPLATPA